MKLNLVSEQLEHFYLKNGLEVYVYNDINSTKFSANMIVKFGSNIDYVGNKKLPAGIAHYLEHVLFNHKDGDYFEQYAKYSGSANAFTTYNFTNYLFTCNENFVENLYLLLTQTNKRYFTKQNIEKERQIIHEELLMYEQMPVWKLRNIAYETICTSTNYKIDIGGTTDSIKEISFELLCEVFDEFYVPSNQKLVLYGNFSNVDIKSILEDYNFDNEETKVTKPSKIQETSNVNHEILEVEMDNLEIDYVQLYIKFNKFDHNEPMYKIALSLFCYSVYSNLNNKYVEAVKNDLIPLYMSNYVINEVDIFAFSINFQDNNYDKYIDNIFKLFEEGVSNESLELAINDLKASTIYSSENRFNFMNKILHQLGDEINIEDYYEAINVVDVKKVRRYLNEILIDYNKSISILKRKDLNETTN